MNANVNMQAASGELLLLIETCAGTGYGDLSSRAAATAHDSILDWLGCAVAGVRTDEARAYARALAPAGGAAPVVGAAEWLHWRDAIEFNALHGHILDFDDMLPAMSAHPSAAILPALLVEAADLGRDLSDVATALVVGTEIGVWVGARVLPRHYDAGWHATGTLGTIAAAAAVCHLRGLAPREWLTAIDLACTQAAGLKALFGTLGKPLHAANAAAGGARAARLATETSSTGDGLLGPDGFIANYSLRDPRTPADSPVDGWAIEGMLYKSFASCFMTQSSVDAGEWIREKFHGGEELTAITVAASPRLRDVCAIDVPTTSTEAKFSLRGTLSLAAAGHDLSAEEAFRPTHLTKPAYLELHRKTSVIFDDELAGDEPRLLITVTTTTGGTVTRTFDRGRPADDLEQRRRSLIGKFVQQTKQTVPPQVIDRILTGSPPADELLTTLNTYVSDRTSTKETANV